MTVPNLVFFASFLFRLLLIQSYFQFCKFYYLVFFEFVVLLSFNSFQWQIAVAYFASFSLYARDFGTFC